MSRQVVNYIFSKNPKKQKISATFHCSISLVGHEINKVVTGKVVGSMISSKKGNDGFGYDPFLFLKIPIKLLLRWVSKKKCFYLIDLKRLRFYQLLKNNWIINHLVI